MNNNKLKSIIAENLVKNFIIIICVFLFYPGLYKSIADISIELIGNLLSVISILLVTVSFASFAFTYEKVKINLFGFRFFAHITTFLFLLITALLLELMTISLGIVYPSLYGIVIFFCATLYVSIIFYDFWDLLRVL